jgi:hypothetical protein
MVSKSDFSPDEWQALTRAPLMAGAYVVGAGTTNPLQLALESEAMVAAVGEATAAGPATLVGAVAADVLPEQSAAGQAPVPAAATGGPPAPSESTAGAAPTGAGAAAGAGSSDPGGAAQQARSFEEFRAEIMTTLQAAAAAAAKAPAEESETYRRWVVYTAQRIAIAAPEGAAYVSGNTIVASGPVVSGEEYQAVDEIAGAMGITLEQPPQPSQAAQPAQPAQPAS